MDARRRASLCVLIALCGSSAVAQPDPSAALRDRYTLTARLDPLQHELHGRATIHWRNRSGVALRFLYLHLYANAFADHGTVFMRERGPFDLPLTRPGGIDLQSLRTEDGSDLLARSDRELIKGDATQLRVELETPLAPAAWLTLTSDFRVRLPSIVARMGANDDFFMIAQWFPKLARLSSEGEFQSFPYHGLGEFDADFSDYELEIEVPAAYVIAAPGERSAREAPRPGWRRESYRLANALDIAFAAYPRFSIARRESPQASIEVYAAPGASQLAEAQAAWLAECIGRLSARLGPYPYKRLVLVLPPRFARGAAGMEYPGLIMGWVIDARFGPRNPIARLVHDDVSAHELAHQWFPITITSDELHTPMLDEGLAQWLGLDLMQARLGRTLFARVLGLPLDMFEIMRARGGSPDSSLRPANRYSSRQLGAIVYGQSALVLETIARSYGRPRLDATLADYARRNRFAHVGFDQFWAAFDRGYGAGFAARVLRPALEGHDVAWPARDPSDRERKHVVRAPEALSPVHAGAARPLYARVVYLVQALLAVLGP